MTLPEISASSPKQIVIIGSGVIGLTIAHVLSTNYTRNEAEITIIARDMPDSSMDSTGWASPWAGANWFPFKDRDPENRWERESYKVFKSDLVPRDLIMDLPSKYYSPKADYLSNIWFQDVVANFNVLPSPLPESISGTAPPGSGFEFITISICVPTYLKWLQDELITRGVKFVKGWVSSLEDVEFVPESNGIKTDVVVNASGLGAKTIVGIADPLVMPIRGQTVLVRAPNVKWCLMGIGLHINANFETIYVIPRSNGDVVVGGTFQEQNWDTSPDPATAKGIIERALVYCPELSPAYDPATPSIKPDISSVHVLRHNVGLRPGREGGARVEQELVQLPLRSWPNANQSWKDMEPVAKGMKDAQSKGALGLGEPSKVVYSNSPSRELKVVHAYGIGSTGYQSSWGIAEDVREMVHGLLGASR